MKLTLAKRLMAIILCATTILLVVGITGVYQIKSISSQLDYVKQTSDHDAVIAGIDLGE